MTLSRISVFVALLAAFALVPARADYLIKDGNGTLQTIEAFTHSGKILPKNVPTDVNGAPLDIATNATLAALATASHTDLAAILARLSTDPATQTTLALVLAQLQAVNHFICDSGCGGSGGTASNFGAAFPTPGTAVGMSQGGNMVALSGTGGNLNVNCAAGCAGGTFNNNADGVATSSSNGQTAAWGYYFNGTTYDRARGDATNGAWVNIKASAAIGVTGTFWQATQPVSAVSWPLPTGAATQTTLAAILTALGTPMQNSGGSVTVNAGTNLNTSALALETGGNLANLVTAVGAVTSSPATFTIGDRLKTINTTLGTPFQAGGSIGNTAFGISGTLPAFAATPTFNLGTLNGAALAAKQPALGTAGTPSADVITVQGAASMTPLKVDGSGVTQPVSAASLPLPSGAATSANQTNASQKTQIVDSSGNVIASTSNNLNVQCANCSGSGVSTADEASMTPGTSLFAGTGGFYQTTATSNPLTTGKQGMWQMTANRAGFVNLRDSSANELGVAAAPLQVSLANTAANSTAVKVDGSAVTQPVSLASVPTHAVTVASGGIASGAIASGAVASGAVSSGAYAAGALAAGAFSSGAGVDGWDLTQGAKADAVCTLPATTTACSVVALLKAIGNAANSSVAAGSNLIGKVGIDQTTPGTTNGTQDASTGSTGSAPPSKAAYIGANGGGATGGQLRGLINCDSHVFKHITSATDTLAVQGVASQTIYICAWRSRAAGTATWFLENTASANANCSSTLTQITGLASEVANSGEVFAPAFWNGLKNTSGNGLCINSTGTGGVDIDIFYTQF